MEKHFATNVPTAAAAPINIIADELIRLAIIPDGSILRGLLTDNLSCQVANESNPAIATSTANEPEHNLQEELGDDNDNEIAHMIAEITSMGEVEEIASIVLPLTSPLFSTPRSHFNREMEEATPPVLTGTSPLPPTPRTHFNQTSTTFSTPGTMPNPEIFSRDIEDR